MLLFSTRAFLERLLIQKIGCILCVAYIIVLNLINDLIKTSATQEFKKSEIF